MNRWTWAALLLLPAAVAGCGSNGTKAGITISAASATTGASSVTVPVGGTEQFGATVTGVSTTTVNWQVCLPSSTTSVLPTVCTTIPGVTPPTGSTVLTGYGTINQNGFYTAPSSIPNPNSFWIVATSPVDKTTFGFFIVTIDSGVRVQVTPSVATLFINETLQFTATVTGSSNTSVLWQVNGVVGGNAQTTGTIDATGKYTAPSSTGPSVSIKAVSGADNSASATASVTILNSAPTVTGLVPEVAPQGAAAEEVFLSGANFTSNGSVLLSRVSNGTASSQNDTQYVFLSSSLLRVAIPAAFLNAPGTVSVAFQDASGGQSGSTETLTVVPTRPAIASLSPNSVASLSGSATVQINGGYFAANPPAGTLSDQVSINNTAASFTIASSRQMSVTVPASVLATPGLYPLQISNPNVPAGQPAMATANIAVTPSASPGAPGPNATISLAAGAAPSSIAMDPADGLAVVAEKGANAIALIDTTSNSLLPSAIAVGNAPTSVAVDDTLPHHLALVVNSGDNSVSVLDLSASPRAVVKTISLTGFTPQAPSYPVSVGINPQTHRAIVANASTNLATIIDLVNSVGSCTAPCPLMTIGGSQTSYGTGANTRIAIDPLLNWALVSPGGAGTINLVDLGYGSPSAGSGGRAPAIMGSLSISTTAQGVAINPETHQALLTDYNSGAVTTYGLLDNTVTAVTNNGAALNLQGEAAAAVDPMLNIGVAVNNSGSGTASIVDLGNSLVLQTVSNLTSAGGTPTSVAIDPATSQAFVTNSSASTVAVVSLSTAPPKPLEILESNPAVTFTTTSPLTLTITGSGFTAGSSVLLDGTALTVGVSVPNARQILATLPANSPLLASARRLAVQVKNADGTVSNVEPLTVVQAIAVGTAPAGVAVDPYRDLAVVTNAGSGNISLVSLAAPSASSPQSLGPVGVVGPALTAHLNPRAVAVDPRLGLAVAANFDSNDLSLVDYSEVNRSTPYILPPVAGCSAAAVCTGPAGIAFNTDLNTFLVTDSNLGTATSDVAFGVVNAPSAASQAGLVAPVSPQPVDQTPGDLALAPSFDPFDPVNNPNPLLSYAAIASASQTSVVDILNTTTELVVGRSNGLVEPSGVIYDWLNHSFLVSDSLNNNLVVINPLTFVPIAMRAGFDPLSLAYNPQTSTIVTVDGANGTLSFLDYLCPPSGSAPACTVPHVRATIGLLGSEVSSTAPLGPKQVDVDPLLNLAVVVDSENNRLLLVPMPN